MSNKVVYAKLHATFFIPGEGNMKDTLPPQDKTLKNLEMTYLEGGSLLMTWDSKPGTKQVRKRFVIGAASVFCAQLADEEPTPPALKAVSA